MQLEQFPDSSPAQPPPTPEDLVSMCRDDYKYEASLLGGLLSVASNEVELAEYLALRQKEPEQKEGEVAKKKEKKPPFRLKTYAERLATHGITDPKYSGAENPDGLSENKLAEHNSLVKDANEQFEYLERLRLNELSGEEKARVYEELNKGEHYTKLLAILHSLLLIVKNKNDLL